MDSSFWFYYPRISINSGIRGNLIEINSISDDEVPDLDALYIGGDFLKPMQRPSPITGGSGIP
jgi:cobyrinic acid a,c-diamide synthase